MPVRQWVLSLPYRLRYLLAWDHALARAVLGVYVRVLLGFQRHRARRYAVRDGRSGCVTVIQRFGGGLNLNLHFHTLLFDGVFFAEGEEGALGFRPLPPPNDDEVGVVLARIAARVQRLLKRRGLDPGDADLLQADPVVEESPALAGISGASIQGRIALGPRAGARVWRVGADPDAPWVLSTAPRHAHLAGFDLHANVAMPAADRTRLEQLCRYLLRPAVAQDRLRLLDDGRIALTLKTAWADGTRQLVFEPLELLEKLAALTPRPRINLVLYHGVASRRDPPHDLSAAQAVDRISRSRRLFALDRHDQILLAAPLEREADGIAGCQGLEKLRARCLEGPRRPWHEARNRLVSQEDDGLVHEDNSHDAACDPGARVVGLAWAELGGARQRLAKLTGLAAPAYVAQAEANHEGQPDQDDYPPEAHRVLSGCARPALARTRVRTRVARLL